MARGKKRKAISKQERKQVEEVEDQKQEEEVDILEEEKQMEEDEDEEQDVEDDKEKQDDKDDEDTQDDEDDEVTQGDEDDEEKQDDEDDEETQDDEDDEEKQDEDDDEEKQDDEDDEETQDDEDDDGEKQDDEDDEETQDDEDDDEENQDDEEGDQDEGENQEDEPEPKKAGRKRKRAGILKPEPKKAGRHPKDTRISKSESGKAGRKAKRTRTSTPEPEPEYLEDKRNLEDLWKEVFPFSMKWGRLDSVYEHNWSFKNLEDAFEEEGALHGRRVYLFGCREPQSVPSKNKERLTHIPVVVAVESPLPPSDKIAIVSVEKENKEIVLMKHMKMNWVPYISLENRESQVERVNSDIFILWCNQRRTALKKEQVEKLQRCLPYFYNPLQEDENTVVELILPIKPKPVVRAFDWNLDEVEDFTDKLIKEEELRADKKEKFMKDLKGKVKAQKKANKEGKVARKKARDELSPEEKLVYENMRIYKFYPVATPDSVNKDLYINQYYGKAHQLL